MTHETDSFIDEVTEEVRRDRLFALFRRYGWIGVAVILAIVAGAGFNEWSRSRAEADARAYGDQVFAALKSDDPAVAMQAVQPGEVPGRAAVTGLLTAAAEVNAANAEAATSQLESAVTHGAQVPVLQDLARLKAVLIGGETMDAAARDAALAELSKPGAPFELLALEQKAVALAEAGRTTDALSLVRQIQNKSGLSPQMQARLADLAVTLGSTPEADIARDKAVTVTPVPANGTPGN